MSYVPRAGPRKAGEYERVRAPTIFWITYISSICGCIYAVVLKGLFGISIAAGSSIISDVAITIASKQYEYRGFNEGALIAVTIFAGLGSFTTALILTSRDNGNVVVLKLLFPSERSWTLRHQLHITMCMCCLAVSHIIIVNRIDQSDPKNYKSSQYLSQLVQRDSAYLFSVLLLSFTMCALSTLLTLNEALALRGGNFTSQVFDFFAGLGFALRSRDCRYLWKSHMLFWCIAGFISGSCIGANSFEETFKVHSVAVPIIMLSPLWLYGCILLKLRGKRRVTEQRVSRNAALLESKRAGTELRPTLNGGAVGVYEQLDLRQFAWIIYICFVAGSVNAISRQGTFKRPSTHITGLVARMSMAMQYPPSLTDRGTSTYSAEEYGLAVLAFGFGGFVSGFTLISTSKESKDGKLYPIQMNFPSLDQWRFNHQLLLSVAIACFGFAQILFQYDSGGDKNHILSNVVVDISSSQNVCFFLAWLLNIFSAALVNGLLCTGAKIILRAGNMDGHVLDLFMGLADCAASRSLRLIWRVRAQAFALVSFFTGCLAGSAVFQSPFGASSLCWGCIALSPLWLTGFAFVLKRRLAMSSPARPVDLGAEYFDEFFNESDDFGLSDPDSRAVSLPVIVADGDPAIAVTAAASGT